MVFLDLKRILEMIYRKGYWVYSAQVNYLEWFQSCLENRKQKLQDVIDLNPEEDQRESLVRECNKSIAACYLLK